MRALLLSLTLFSVACGDEEPTEPAVSDISFADEVAPVLLGSCALDGCHADDGKGAWAVPAGQDATDEVLFDSLRGNALNGKPLIDPGRTGNSEIILRLDAEFGLMPPLQKLPADQQNTLRFWVADGAPNN